MASGSEDRPHEESDELDRLLAFLREVAEDAVRTHRLPRDQAQDLVHEAIASLWGPEQRPPTDGTAEAEIRRLAQREQQRRRREAARLRKAPRPAPSGVPTLCPRLAALAPVASSPTLFERTLLAAAATIARHPGVLRGEQFRLFHLAYVERQDLDEIVRTLGWPKRRALQKRLRRLSRRLEGKLLDRVQAHIPAHVWPRLLALVGRPGSASKKSRIAATPDAPALCAAAQSALEADIHRDPGPNLS